jgi:hypothetical protein
MSNALATTLRLPNLIVIGVSKAGTSSLFEYLGRHPEVDLSDVKEVRYFTPLRHGQELAPLVDYAQHFADCDQRYAVEATPGYFYGGRKLASVMRSCHQPRVVVSLRDPISRCWSWYRFEKSRLRVPKRLAFDAYLDTCIRLNDAGLDGLPEHQPFWGVGGGCYDRWLDDWIDVFGDDLKVLFFDDLASDPEAVMIDLFDWLELDGRQAETSNLQAVNATQEYRVKAAQRVAVSLNRRGERFFRHHPRAKRLLRSGYYALNRDKPAEQMSSAARERLECFYLPHNLRLAKQLERIGLTVPTSWKR